jgi:cell wall assembly regulator SMI1
MNSDLIQRFCQCVLERGGDLCPPITSENLEQFERQRDLKLPIVLRDLYLISNGTEYDDDFLNRVLPLEELRISEDTMFGKVMWFFEHCIFSKVWGVVVSSGQVINGNDGVIMESISDFLEQYIDPGLFNARNS